MVTVDNTYELLKEKKALVEQIMAPEFIVKEEGNVLSYEGPRYSLLAANTGIAGLGRKRVAILTFNTHFSEPAECSVYAREWVESLRVKLERLSSRLGVHITLKPFFGL